MNNNKNNIYYNNKNENNISNYFKNAKKNNYKNFNEFRIDRNININDDLDSKDSMEDIDKSFRHKNNNYLIRKNTRLIDYEIQKGNEINPCKSFDINDDKNKIFERNNTFKDYNSIYKKNSFLYNSKEIKFKNSNNIPLCFHYLRSRTISYILQIK